MDFKGFSTDLAAELALYASDAEQLFRNIDSAGHANGTPVLPDGTPYPAVDPTLCRVNQKDWMILGELRADDDLRNVDFLKKLVGLPANNYFFGFLLKRVTKDPYFNPGDFLVIIRGTMQPVEWLLNIIAVPDIIASKAHPIAGEVPEGFYSIYNALTLIDEHGKAYDDASQGIADLFGRPPDGRLMVVGHSLGSALGTYLLHDLSTKVFDAGESLFGYLYASPKPGDDDYVKDFRDKVPNYNVVNFTKDIVPRVPPVGYRTLLGGTAGQNVYTIDRSNTKQSLFPTDNPGANHNAINYAIMLSGNAKITPAVSPRG